MSAIAKMRARLAALRSESGATLIEFGFALPIMLVFLTGGMELTNYILVQMEVNRIAAMTADNSSRLRTPMTESYINQLFTGVDKAGANIDFKEHGRVILSSVQNNTKKNGQWITWQRCFGDLNIDSKYGKEGLGKSNNKLPSMNGLTAQSGSALMYAEVYYDYQPLIASSVLSSRRVTHEVAFVVRQRTDYSISGKDPAKCN